MAGLCEEICKRISREIDGGEGCLIVELKSVEVSKPACSKHCAMGRSDIDRAPSYGYYASQRKFYFGYKLHGLTGTSGVFHSYDITAANIHDFNYLNDVKLTRIIGRISTFTVLQYINETNNKLIGQIKYTLL